MDRNTSCLVARTAAKEALRTLAPVFVNHLPAECYRERIKISRDRLHAACCLFEGGDTAEVEEDLYLPLFDALALLTAAVGVKPVKRKPIEAARDQLLKLSDV